MVDLENRIKHLNPDNCTSIGVITAPAGALIFAQGVRSQKCFLLKIMMSNLTITSTISFRLLASVNLLCEMIYLEQLTQVLYFLIKFKSCFYMIIIIIYRIHIRCLKESKP